jgi:hypothetical protein
MIVILKRSTRPSSAQMGRPPATERMPSLPFPGFPDRETLHRFGLDPESA